MIVVGGAVWVTGAGEYAVWWLTNTTPPTVSLEAPGGAVRGNVTIGVRVGPDGRAGPIDRLGGAAGATGSWATVSGAVVTAQRHTSMARRRAAN